MAKIQKKPANQNHLVNLGFSISPDITIEFIKPKQNGSPSDIENKLNDETMTNEEDFDAYFSPLIYCAITMDDNDDDDDDDDDTDNEPLDYRKNYIDTEVFDNNKNIPKNDLNACKILNNESTTLKNIKKTQKNLQSNENSSFVCNSSDSNNGNKNKKRFSCHICQKTFGWTTDLKRHILIHTGERPFKCTLCLATFTRNFLLQKHKTKIHQCLSPNEISQLNNSVAKNLMEIKLKMRELEQAKITDEENTDIVNKTHKNKKSKQKN